MAVALQRFYHLVIRRTPPLDLFRYNFALKRWIVLMQAREKFRDKLKKYHPDVYVGSADPNRITARLLLAYEIIKEEVEGEADSENYAKGNFIALDTDPFNDPKGPADRIFVNELNCMGKSCSSSCVDKMPECFQYSPDTLRARCVSSEAVAQLEEPAAFKLYMTASQCPRSCIHYVTQGQQKVLQNEFQLFGPSFREQGSLAITDGGQGSLASQEPHAIPSNKVPLARRPLGRLFSSAFMPPRPSLWATTPKFPSILSGPDPSNPPPSKLETSES
eukprot:1183859-Prorocentrum_minimum.AAC.4